MAWVTMSRPDLTLGAEFGNVIAINTAEQWEGVDIMGANNQAATLDLIGPVCESRMPMASAIPAGKSGRLDKMGNASNVLPSTYADLIGAHGPI